MSHFPHGDQKECPYSVKMYWYCYTREDIWSPQHKDTHSHTHTQNLIKSSLTFKTILGLADHIHQGSSGHIVLHFRQSLGTNTEHAEDSLLRQVIVSKRSFCCESLCRNDLTLHLNHPFNNAPNHSESLPSITQQPLL